MVYSCCSCLEPLLRNSYGRRVCSVRSLTYVVNKQTPHNLLSRTQVRQHSELQYFITARKRSLGQGNIFTPVCHSVHRGGMHSWSGGACVVALGGACVVALGGACVAAPGGQGACMVAPGGHAWLLPGGACVVTHGGHAWLLPGGRRAWDTTRYGDMVNERAVRILLECILVLYNILTISMNVSRETSSLDTLFVYR